MQENEQKDATVESLLASLEDLKSNTVSKEQYEKTLQDNLKLVDELAKNRSVVTTKEDKEDTPQEILDRCKERTKRVVDGTQLDAFKNLTENYRDMQKLGMDVSNVDESMVGKLESLIEESGGDPIYFNSLCESKIKVR